MLAQGISLKQTQQNMEYARNSMKSCMLVKLSL